MKECKYIIVKQAPSMEPYVAATASNKAIGIEIRNYLISDNPRCKVYVLNIENELEKSKLLRMVNYDN